MEQQALSREQGFVSTFIPNVIVGRCGFYYTLTFLAISKNVEDVQRRLWEPEVLDSLVTEHWL